MTAPNRDTPWTPGPWATNGRTIVSCELLDADNPKRGLEIIADHVWDEANAHLIKMAPALAEALERIYHEHSWCTGSKSETACRECGRRERCQEDGWCEGCQEQEQVGKLLRQARGEQP